MNTLNHSSNFEQESSFDEGIDFGDFDLGAAFQDAFVGVATDNEIALDEKIKRMEFIVNEGASDLYRDFVDFREIASQMEMMCAHDHSFNEAVQGNESLSGLMNSHKSDNDQRFDRFDSDHKKNKAEFEIDPKTGKKTKKKKKSLSILSLFTKK